MGACQPYYCNEHSRLIDNALKEPFWRVLKEKANVTDEHKFLSECIQSEVILKEKTPNAQLRVKDSPVELTTKWNEILHKCGSELMVALVNHHEAAQVIQKRFLELIPEWITVKSLQSLKVL